MVPNGVVAFALSAVIETDPRSVVCPSGSLA